MKNTQFSILGAMTCIALLATTGCGTVQEEAEPTAEAETGTAESALTIYPCGIGCPSGYYPTQVNSNPWCGSAYGNYSTTCNSISGTPLYTCGTSCPSGYYPTQVNSNPWCGSAYGNYSTTCNAISGSPLYTCGTSCPSGYYPTQVNSNPWCGSVYGNYSTTCRR